MLWTGILYKGSAMNKNLLVDVDSVLLRWRDGFKLYMEHQGHEWLDIDDDYDMSQHFNLTYDEVYECILKFNNGHWEFGVLEPVDGAVDAIKRLTYTLGYRLIVITACSTHPQAKALRQANLYNVFGDVFDAVHCVDISESKETHLADYDPTFWIEDNFKNCVDGIKYGHKCLLLNYPWNQNEKNTDIIRCADWGEVLDFIEQNKNFSNIRT